MAISSRPTGVGDVPAGQPRPDPPPPDPARTRLLQPVPLSVAVLAVPALIGGLRLIFGLHRPFDLAGDAAILEAAIRRVAHGTQLLGPYSRFGFKQPGPAYFFVQAPFYWAGRGSARALFLGALCINLGAAIGALLVVRRFLGEPAARWAAIVVGSFLVVLTPALLADPWNPYVLALPLLLTALLSGAAAAGSGAAAAGAVVLGSSIVQTHLATGPTVLALFAVAIGVRFAVRTPRPPAAARRRLAVGLGTAVALAVLWVPPLVEQATHSPGNLTALAGFFRERHPEFDRSVDHGVGAAADSVAAQLTVLPFGRHLGSELASPAQVAVAGAGLLVAAAVAGAGWRRRQAVVVALGACSLVGAAAAVWSVTRVVGEVLPHLLLWSAMLLLPAWIGAGVLLLGRRPALWANRIVPVVSAAVGAALGWSMLQAPLPPISSAPDVGAVAGLARPWLAARGASHVRVRLGEFDQWPLVAGVLVRLEKDGLDVTVDHQWALLFGDQFAPTGQEEATLWLTAPADGSPSGAQATRRLGLAGGAAVWAEPVGAR